MSRKILFVALALIVIVHVVTADSMCQMERKQALQDKLDGKMVEVVPRCKDNGDYKKAQCNLSKGVCFCVDQKTGKEKTKARKGGTSCKPSKS